MTSLLIDKYWRDTSTCAYVPDIGRGAYMRGNRVCLSTLCLYLWKRLLQQYALLFLIEKCKNFWDRNWYSVAFLIDLVKASYMINGDLYCNLMVLDIKLLHFSWTVWTVEAGHKSEWDIQHLVTFTVQCSSGTLGALLLNIYLKTYSLTLVKQMFQFIDMTSTFCGPFDRPSKSLSYDQWRPLLHSYGVGDKALTLFHILFEH